MPIYMDRHDLSKVTAEDVAKVHQEDIKIQDQFGCRGLTYWFDEKRGTAFCLIEAPEANAVKDMHNCAHGMIPTDIIEVDAQLVAAFLGRIDNPSSAKEESELVIREAGLRTILITSPGNTFLLKAKVGKEKALSLLTLYKQVTTALAKKFDGRVVDFVGNCFTLSFQRPGKAVLLAKELQEAFADKQEGLSIKIGISAGDPVNQNPQLFGEAIQLAKRLCELSTCGQIMVSAETTGQLKSDWMQESPVAKVKQLNPENERFLNRLMDLMEEMWDKTGLNIHQLEQKLGMSKAQLYRKITAVSIFSPNDFIKEFRLKKALEALSKQSGNVSEIAYSCGFASPSYFSKCFLERFGILPSSLISSDK